MAKIDDIRRTNARALAEQAGGPAKFARKMGLSDSRVSQLIGMKFTRNIGDKTASQIEQMFNEEQGWLDVDHSKSEEVDATSEDVKLVQMEHISLSWVTFEELELLTAFRLSTEMGRDLMKESAKIAEKDAQKLPGSMKRVI